ncbi:universal stress protein [Dactylosporangium sp. CA-233914]|uniref:universal stress protein n=1 Tax=Dactylosporangium sp. CA-233914 TaxID=3239934 RepID=UPI003D922AC0
MQAGILIGYDGSPAAGAAIEAGAQLFPRACAWIAHLWAPPFGSASLRARLWTGTSDVDDYVEAVEREGRREAERLADDGVILAGAAGWDAEPLVVCSFGGEGPRLAELSEQVDADVLLLGSRGLGGTRALLGSVSDMAVHYSSRPVLVVPHPLLAAEFAALADGAVLIGYDDSPGARTALTTAARLFPARPLLLATVDDGHATEEVAGPSPAAGAEVTRLYLPSGHGPHGRAIAESLAGCARSRSAALLVVGSRGRSAVRKILLGSVAMAVLHHAGLPVLVVPGTAGDER